MAVAKVLHEFAKGNEKFVIKAGAMPKLVMSAKEVASLATMPSREELLAKLLGTMQAPVAQVRADTERGAGQVRARRWLLCGIQERSRLQVLARIRLLTTTNDLDIRSREMAVAKAEILDAIANMTVLELSELIKEMEEKFGVSAAAAAVAVAAPAAGGAAAAGCGGADRIHCHADRRRREQGQCHQGGARDDRSRA